MKSAERREKIRAILDRVAERPDREWPENEAHINELEDLAERASLCSVGVR